MDDADDVDRDVSVSKQLRLIKHYRYTVMVYACALHSVGYRSFSVPW